MVKAFGSACYATSSLTIVAQSFPGKIAAVTVIWLLFNNKANLPFFFRP
jgi:hypothetical protein